MSEQETVTVTSWMQVFRWIVKLIRDDFGIDEKRLTRTAVLDEIGLAPEQLEQVLDFIREAFSLRFPDDTLDEVVGLEDLCMLVSWIKGVYKKPDFVTPAFEAACREINEMAD